MSGGSMVAPELVKRAGGVRRPIQIVYGQTEARRSSPRPGTTIRSQDLTETIGQPMPHIEVAILTPHTQRDRPDRHPGRDLHPRLPRMLGYNDNPEATASAIDAEGWLHTGDLGTMDARGYVKITGRVKEMIIRGGENLFPAEIENAMLEHDASRGRRRRRPRDWASRSPASCAPPAPPARRRPSLKAFVRERLSHRKRPRKYWIWVDQWPLTGSGKIQKFKLPRHSTRGELEPQPA